MPQPTAAALHQDTDGGGHIMFPLLLLAQAGLSDLSGETLLSLHFNALSGPKTDFHQARPCYGMLRYILSSQEYSHFSEQMPIERSWCQAHHMQDVLCSSISNRRLADTAALSPRGSITNRFPPPAPRFSKDPVTLGGKKTTLYLIYN